MRILHLVIFCCILGVCAEASGVLEVSGHVGGEVSILCFWHHQQLGTLQHEVNLKVEDASTVPVGPPPSTTTPSLQTEAQALPQGSSASSTEASTLPTTETNQPAATKLKDATMVIIVSVTLALLVCSIIPLIFYGHCRNNAEGLNKSESDYCEENTDGASTHSAVRLQALEAGADPESSIPDASQYAAVYQALDPKTMD
ncbi:hypothetical protein KUCAC02_016334 [Chaenocephalus aceratus]|uniref:Uncharacterized protein n=1 Tax=Chaenocephalus aceratus TaxID=36190 RepID=A0ACB9Y120_CHAAC|nr:hypothetical protein KUCAC02_016334 [Chaenocephalus aceratus]